MLSQWTIFHDFVLKVTILDGNVLGRQIMILGYDFGRKVTIIDGRKNYSHLQTRTSCFADWFFH